ncbi:MAG: hypothetical protein AAGE85_08295 [Pseudomonadota bacterium]
MNKAQIIRRLYWTRITFTIFAASLLFGALFEALDMPNAFLWFVLLPLLAAFLAFAIAFGALARSLGESATSWVATVVLLPVIGLVLAYLHFGRKYRKAMRESREERP